MKRILRALIALGISACVVLSLFAITGGTLSFTDDGMERFYSDLNAIYREYNRPLEGAEAEDEFALMRLVVSDYNGRRYGATARAWDKRHGYAVLQYKTREEAVRAKELITADGLIAEGDGPAWLDSTYGSLYPEGGNYVGTTQYNNKISTESEDVVVAVIDTGVMYDHELISDRFLSHGVDLSEDGNEDAYYDVNQTLAGDYYHSTAVCGVIADNTPSNVKILPIKVVPFTSTTTVASSIVAGINYAVDHDVDVMNLSLYTNKLKIEFTSALRAAINKKICVCTSSGNGVDGQGVLVENRYPTCTDGAIVVGALNGIREPRQVVEEVAEYSNYGDEVDFIAPGTNVITTAPKDGEAKRFWASGTSFSTPYIAACCADLKTVNKDLSRDEIYGILKDFSRDLGDEGKDDYYGWGAPDISDIVYTDGSSYTYKIPECTVEITEAVDFTEDTLPWKSFADKLVSVSFDDSVTRIGNYNLCNVKNAQLSLPSTIYDVGDGAFKNCTQLSEFTFSIDVNSVGADAFAGIDNFTINGYRNTAAEDYAIENGVTFNELGCRHNYIFETFDPSSTQEGYTLYTCTVCGDTYRGAYIPPVALAHGSCGENLTYTVYDTGKLTIDGTGDMYDYINEPAPWYDYRNDITILQINQYVERISPFAFYNCKAISKIRLDESNTYYCGNELNLISAQDGELLLTCARGEYELSEDVEVLNPAAFFTAGAISFSGNSRFTVQNKLVYDNNGNIVMALPSYSDNTLAIDGNITIKQYAFILTEYPAVFDSKRLNVTLEPYSIGYYYDGALTRRDLIFRVCADSLAYEYADINGFTVNGYDAGKCGDDLIWQYNTGSKTLTFTGSGDMYVYASAGNVPWSSVLSEVKTIEIDDKVTSVSPYAFGDATNLRTLTMPLSMRAPDATVWANCTGITTLRLTLGTGRTDDYEGDVYKYTPWNLSRTKITSFSLDSDVRYIGIQAFRNCTAITSLTFNCIEKINTDAFLACSNLKDYTILNKDSVIVENAIMSYYFNKQYRVYSGSTLHAYSDSTAHEYALVTGGNFDSLGCGHSIKEHVTLVDDGSYCTVCEKHYHCSDCDSDFTEYLEGHSANISVKSTNGAPIGNALVSANGKALGTTSGDGTLNCRAYCGEYDIDVEVNSLVYQDFSLTVERSNVNAEIDIHYGDFNSDGVINAKDYAYSLRHGYGGSELFDWGRINSQDNRIIVSREN